MAEKETISAGQSSNLITYMDSSAANVSFSDFSSANFAFFGGGENGLVVRLRDLSVSAKIISSMDEDEIARCGVYYACPCV